MPDQAVRCATKRYERAIKTPADRDSRRAFKSGDVEAATIGASSATRVGSDQADSFPSPAGLTRGSMIAGSSPGCDPGTATTDPDGSTWSEPALSMQYAGRASERPDFPGQSSARSGQAFPTAGDRGKDRTSSAKLRRRARNRGCCSMSSPRTAPAGRRPICATAGLQACRCRPEDLRSSQFAL